MIIYLTHSRYSEEIWLYIANDSGISHFWPKDTIISLASFSENEIEYDESL